MLLWIWWDYCGIIYKEYMESRQAINSTIYIMLIKVRYAIQEISSEGRWFFFVKITPGHMLLRWKAWRCTKWTGIWCNFHHTAQTWRLWISICFPIRSCILMAQSSVQMSNSQMKSNSFWTRAHHNSSQKGLKNNQNGGRRC